MHTCSVLIQVMCITSIYIYIAYISMRMRIRYASWRVIHTYIAVAIHTCIYTIRNVQKSIYIYTDTCDSLGLYNYGTFYVFVHYHYLLQRFRRIYVDIYHYQYHTTQHARSIVSIQITPSYIGYACVCACVCVRACMCT